MSRTQAVQYRDRQFWAFDAAVAVWLAEFLALADDAELESDPWWAERLQQWRVEAVLGANVGHNLPDDWDEGRIGQFLEVSRAAIDGLRIRGAATGSELAALVTLEGEATCADRYGSMARVELEPIAALGEAIVDLVLGRLPLPPEGTWWYFGEGPEPTTIAMRGDVGKG